MTDTCVLAKAEHFYSQVSAMLCCFTTWVWMA